MFGTAQALIIGLISYAVFALAMWALIDAVRAPGHAYSMANKQSKALWVTLTAVATALLFAFLPYPLGASGGPFNIFGIAATAASIIYLVSVRPALAPYRGSRGPRRNDRGGW